MTRRLRRRSRLLPAAAALAATLAAGGCGADPTPTAGGSPTGPSDTLRVIAGFYPLEYAATRVGGSRVTVTALTAPGAEPHDLELTPRDVAAVGEARLVVYLKGFQPAVDQAVANQAARTGFDVSGAARLDVPAEPEPGGTPDADHDHGESAMDPHFWLDPTRYAAVVTALGERLATDDPAHAAEYRANAAAFVQSLQGLDGEFSTGTATCGSRELVTSHAAFGYLAQRYRFTQLPIAGISPEAEPSPAKLAEVSRLVKERGVQTIYTEPLVDPALARTVATGTGAQVATLDPIEGLTPQSAGTDYLAVMRANLAALRSGQRCS